MKKLLNVALKISVLTGVMTLVSCSGPSPSPGPGPGPSTNTTTTTTTTVVNSIGAHASPSILASEFVSALNSVDGTYSSYVKLYTNETLRSKQAGQEQWFVIWDAKFGEYKAVSLNYVRAIVYYDYFSNNHAVASEFRSIERSDVLSGNLNGDTYGNDYEVTDLLSSGYYQGRNSGYLYEDEAGSTDVSLLAKEQEQAKFFEKASKVSLVFNVSLETSMSLVTLGAKVEKMLSRANNNELTLADQSALVSDLKTLTGVSFEEIEKAAVDSKAKAEVLAKVAKKIGTSSQNLEQRLLPEVFGITL